MDMYLALICEWTLSTWAAALAVYASLGLLPTQLLPSPPAHEPLRGPSTTNAQPTKNCQYFCEETLEEVDAWQCRGMGCHCSGAPPTPACCIASWQHTCTVTCTIWFLQAKGMKLVAQQNPALLACMLLSPLPAPTPTLH